MQDEDKSKFSTAIETSSEPVSVRSAFTLAMKQQGAVQSALDETFQQQIRVRYEVAPTLIGGIDLTAQGHRLVWSIAGYIAALEREIV